VVCSTAQGDRIVRFRRRIHGRNKCSFKRNAAPELKEVYEKLTHNLGHMPNVFAVMANRPAALQHFLLLYGAVINGGTIEPKYKELAYLKTSMVNGCEY
jgi:alkylhydroperoxidase family enzyme